MRFDYDPNFIEQATFLIAKRDPEQECVLHEHLDPLYRISDAELRQRAFREAYGALFRHFGLDQFIPRLVGEFPLVTRRLTRCIVREAERNRAQSVDLYTQKSDKPEGDEDRTLIMALCPESLVDQERMTPWLRRQLQHVEDTVDEGFAYETRLPDVSSVQQNLIRDRYAVLWDIYVEGRLIRSKKLSDPAAGELWRSFAKAFARGKRVPSRITFERLYGSDDLTHAQMLRWATDPGTLLEEGEGEKDVRKREAPSCAGC